MVSDLESTLAPFHLFGDPTRVRLAALLARHELTVAELTVVTGLPQSRVSTHLGKLREAGVLRDRRAGASTLYAMNGERMPPGARRVWALLDQAVDDPMLAADRRRCEGLLRARARRTDWPDAVAGQMERHYSPGRTWEATARALLGFVQLGDVLDVGSGDGVIAQLVVSRARSVTCLDRSARVLTAARARLGDGRGVRFVHGDMHALPLGAARFDQVLLLNVLACTREPARVLAEAARVLRPGGRLTAVTLGAHGHLEVTQAYGHVQAGYRPAALRALLARAGLAVEHCEVTSRERREPHFDVLTAVAHKAA